ncbi:hypothetical protein AVEN_233780-1 [Araneus ventricosus]|uniref:DDE-1 domain-containing protein n=1 Tax=Araneus ventricosus TaxID=182803 RepID=A0A4Y2IDN3_ARAVE|nr:hypothetical protein AVEN_233780-1 [Araneus ventricosus]
MVQLSFELAVINPLHTSESRKKQDEAGEDWLYGFWKWHPNTVIQKPGPTSLESSTALNKFNVTEFFSNLEMAYKRIPEDKLNPSCIYNLDETGLATVHNPPKVLSQMGQKQIGEVTFGERGVLVTMCGFINASGNSIPPYLVFPRVNFKFCMLNGAPPGTVGDTTKYGWMNRDIFVNVLKHFQAHAHSSKGNPVVLKMGNHESI